MADGVVVKLNLPDFRRQLAQLSDLVERRIATRAIRAAGKVFQAGARRLAPVLHGKDPRRRAGALRQAIYVGRSRESRKGLLIYKVSVRATGGQEKRGIDPFYWRFLEGGWQPRGRSKGLKGGNRSKAVQRARALKAGGRRRSFPFLKPAFEENGAAALAAFVSTMEQGLAEEVNKL